MYLNKFKTFIIDCLGSQILGFYDIQSPNSIFIQYFNLKIWKVDNKALLDFRNALLQDIVCFFFRQIWTVITIHNTNAKHASISMSGKWSFYHRCQVIHPVKFWTCSLTVASQKKVHHIRGLKGKNTIKWIFWKYLRKFMSISILCCEESQPSFDVWS